MDVSNLIPGIAVIGYKNGVVITAPFFINWNLIYYYS